MKNKTAVIVGGGASGQIAAISLARALKKQGEEVDIIILERLDRVGKKLLATGNGTCNLTNKKCTKSRYHSQNLDLAEKVLNGFTLEQTLEFFKSIGIMTRVDGEKIYPYSLQASSVLDCIRAETKRLGVKEKCISEVTSIVRKDGKFRLRTKTDIIRADTVIFCSGGKTAPSLGGSDSGYKLLKSIGHTVNDVFPAIVQIKCSSPVCKSLKGIKFDGRISVLLENKNYRTERGEILFTEYGLSGPPVLQVSHAVSEFFNLKNSTVDGVKHRDISLALDLMPEYNAFEVMAMIKDRVKIRKGETLEDFFTGMINKRLGQALLKNAGIAPLSRKTETLMPQEIEVLAQMIKCWKFSPTGTMNWQNAQVTAGGIPLTEFDIKTMRSRKMSGVFAAGELLDVDGDCGGFNLQWAWSSGYLAGVSAAQYLIGGGTNNKN